MSAYAELAHATTEEEAREAMGNIDWECRREQYYDSEQYSIDRTEEETDGEE